MTAFVQAVLIKISVDDEMEEIARCNQRNATSSRVLIAGSSVLPELLFVANNGLIYHVAPMPSYSN